MKTQDKIRSLTSVQFVDIDTTPGDSPIWVWLRDGYTFAGGASHVMSFDRWREAWRECLKIDVCNCTECGRQG